MVATLDDSLSDAEIVRRVLAGKREDLEMLVKRYFAAVRAVTCGHTGNETDAEDIAQETFVKAFKSFEDLRRKLHRANAREACTLQKDQPLRVN